MCPPDSICDTIVVVVVVVIVAVVTAVVVVAAAAAAMQLYTVNEKGKIQTYQSTVLSVHFAKNNVGAIIRDDEFLPTLKQQLTGWFCTYV